MLPHAQSRIARRGFTVAQAIEAIQTENWKPAAQNRYECRKRFLYDRDWNGIHYRFLEVRPIFEDHTDEIVVVMVYTYFY